MSRPTPLPPQLASRPFRVAEAVALGVPRYRRDARDLIRPFQGVRAPIGDVDLRQRCRALLVRMREADAFDGLTAAALWGVPLPAHIDPSRSLCVATIGESTRFRRAGVEGRRRQSARVIDLDGLPVVAPAEAWHSLALELDLASLVAAGDFLITTSPRHEATMSRDALREVIDARASERGTARCRAAERLVRDGSWSRPESLLRILLGAAGLPEPQLNPELVLGSRIVHPDLYWHEFGVAVEYNGGHHEDRRQFTVDLQRIEAMHAAGIASITIERGELFGAPARCVARVAEQLRRHGWRGRIRVERAERLQLLP